MDRPPVHTDEGELLDRARSGDGEAWRVLFERYREVAYRVARRVTGDDEDALDAVQDGFVRAYRNLGTFAGASSFKTWLMRIVYRRGIDIRRARPKARIVSMDQGEQTLAPNLPDTREGSDPAGPADRAELGERIARAMEQLPADQRRAFVLHAEGDMTYARIAEEQGVPIGTIMSRIFYARRKLREILADETEGPDGKTKEAEQ